MYHHYIALREILIISFIATLLYQEMNCYIPSILFLPEKPAQDCRWNDFHLRLWRSVVLSLAVTIIRKFWEYFIQ